MKMSFIICLFSRDSLLQDWTTDSACPPFYIKIEGETKDKLISFTCILCKVMDHITEPNQICKAYGQEIPK